MPSISARAASSSTTSTRPRLDPFWTAVGGTAPILRCRSENPVPPGREHPAGWSSRTSVAVVVALERTLHGHADVVGLHLGQLVQLPAEGVEVQARHVLVELLRQHGDRRGLAGVLVALGPQLDLG